MDLTVSSIEALPERRTFKQWRSDRFRPGLARPRLSRHNKCSNWSVSIRKRPSFRPWSCTWRMLRKSANVLVLSQDDDKNLQDLHKWKSYRRLPMS